MQKSIHHLVCMLVSVSVCVCIQLSVLMCVYICLCRPASERIDVENEKTQETGFRGDDNFTGSQLAEKLNK